MPRVIVVDYEPSWPAVFAQISGPILDAVSDIAIAIEHVGSTAVRGLAAKPVIDIDVVVPRGRVADAIARLETLGYEHRGDLGVPQREAFRRPPGLPRHHLYLCPEGSLALANHLAVRDYLRAHPVEARAYGELKKRLAGEFAHDIDGYIAGKTDFLLAILRTSGLEPPLLDDIEHINRRPGDA